MTQYTSISTFHFAILAYPSPKKNAHSPPITRNPRPNHSPHHGPHRHPQSKRRKYNRPCGLVPHIGTHDPKSRRDRHAEPQTCQGAKDADGDEVADETGEEGAEGVEYEAGEVE